MGAAHHFADASIVLAEREHGRGGASPAALVDQPGQRHIVALTHAALFVGVELGHGEQRDALDAGGRVRQACQHQVHDVLAQLVVAAGDENFLTLDAVAAIAHGGGAGLEVAQTRSRLWLGQGHGPEKAATAQRLQVARFLQLAAEFLDHVGV